MRTDYNVYVRKPKNNLWSLLLCSLPILHCCSTLQIDLTHVGFDRTQNITSFRYRIGFFS